MPDQTNGSCDEGAEPRFETALQGLDRAIQRLEGGELSLDEALACYEQGVKLLRDCRGILEKAEQRVAQLLAVDGDGHPVTEPFDASATFDPNVEARTQAPRAAKPTERPRSTRSRPLAPRQSPGVFGGEDGDPPF